MFLLASQMSLATKCVGLSVCRSVGLSVCRSVCRRVFYLGVQMFCSETLRWGAFSTYPACIQRVVSVVDHLHFFVHTVARFRASARYEERVVECYVPMPRQILQ